MEKYFNINANGCSIRCKLYTNAPDRADTVILFGHGFGGHKDNRAAERFAGRVMEKNKNAALVTFNWPCHGDDVRRTLRLEDCMTYLGEVISYLKGRFPDAALLGYATSFGGYMFLKYISENGLPFEKAAFRCPAVDMYDVLAVRIMTPEERKTVDRGKAAEVGFDRKVRIDKTFLDSLTDSRITERDFTPWAPDLLILHGTADEIVPFESAKAFAERNAIDFISVEGADHRFRDARKMAVAEEYVTAFFDLN